MDESQLSQEELIVGMTPDEICELLEEIGVVANEEQASAMQRLVAQLGSLEAALDALGGDDTTDRRAA